MVIKITPQQAKRVNALLRKLCANYDGGNCLLLDDGEPCVCVQSISKYGIYCNYFKNAVLPVDEGLHAEIMKPTDGKRCVCCAVRRLRRGRRISVIVRPAPPSRNG